MLSGCAIGAGVMACADTAKDKANAAIPSDLIIPTSLEAPNRPTSRCNEHGRFQFDGPVCSET